MQLSKKAQSLLLPSVSPKMLYPEYWLERFPDFELEQDWIGTWRAQPELSLNKYFANIDDRIENLSDKNGLLPEKIIDRFIQWNQPEFGLITKACDLKLLPWENPLLFDKEEPDLDRNQLSKLNIGDQVVIYGKSTDGEWFIAVTDAGAGWIKRGMVGIGSKTEVCNFTNEQSRMVLIDPNTRIQTGELIIAANMGCSFPIHDYLRRTILIPRRNAEGNVRFTTGVVVDEAVRDYLPKTVHHLIGQAFKYLGHPYAWGDHDPEGYGLDCSRLVRDVLRTMGFKPPRNSQEQLAAGKKRINLTSFNNDQRLNRLKKLTPGSLLFTPRHVMIFLGEDQNEVYVIHALYNYKQKANNGEESVKVKQVAVSGLTLGTGTATGSILDQLTEAIEV
jgi:hypothetical protein